MSLTHLTGTKLASWHTRNELLVGRWAIPVTQAHWEALYVQSQTCPKQMFNLTHARRMFPGRRPEGAGGEGGA